MKRRFFSAVFSAVILAMASVSVTASAAETTAVSEEATEVTVTTTAVSTESESGDSSDAPEKASIDYFGDDYYDTSGNATLIKEESIIYKSEEMQFIAVTTKDGHVFYVLINYSAANGEDNVYFLNKVDSIDLYSLIYMTDDEKENGIDPANISKAESAALAALEKEKPDTVSSNDNADTTEQAETDEASTDKPAGKTMNMTMVYLAIGLVALGGVGFFGFKFMNKTKKNNGNVNTEAEPIEFCDDEEINEDEE